MISSTYKHKHVHTPYVHIHMREAHKNARTHMQAPTQCTLSYLKINYYATEYLEYFLFKYEPYKANVALV